MLAIGWSFGANAGKDAADDTRAVERMPYPNRQVGLPH